MGLKAAYLDFIESSIGEVYGKNVSNLRILELGDQVIGDPSIIEETGKIYFINRGYVHTSVDLNGLHGAVIRDLTQPEQFYDWHNSYDIMINAGTTEHVEPYEAQYECFSVIHSCIKVGGVFIHLVPDVYEHDEKGAWKNHCRYYYSSNFFRVLAKECGYKLLSNTVIRGMRCVALRKTKDTFFMRDRGKFLSLVACRKYKLSFLVKQKVINGLRRVGLSS